MRGLVVLVLGALALWILPAFGPSGDAVIPTPMVFWLIAVLVVSGAGLAGLSIAWRWPGLLAVLGLLWAAALVPDVLATGGSAALPAWPSVPTGPRAIALWRVLALVLGAVSVGALALSQAPRHAPVNRRGRATRAPRPR